MKVLLKLASSQARNKQKAVHLQNRLMNIKKANEGYTSN